MVRVTRNPRSTWGAGARDLNTRWEKEAPLLVWRRQDSEDGPQVKHRVCRRPWRCAHWPRKVERRLVFRVMPWMEKQFSESRVPCMHCTRDVVRLYKSVQGETPVTWETDTETGSRPPWLRAHRLKAEGISNMTGLLIRRVPLGVVREWTEEWRSLHGVLVKTCNSSARHWKGPARPHGLGFRLLLDVRYSHIFLCISLDATRPSISWPLRPPASPSRGLLHPTMPTSPPPDPTGPFLHSLSPPSSSSRPLASLLSPRP